MPAVTATAISTHPLPVDTPETASLNVTVNEAGTSRYATDLVAEAMVWWSMTSRR